MKTAAAILESANNDTTDDIPLAVAWMEVDDTIPLAVAAPLFAQTHPGGAIPELVYRIHFHANPSIFAAA